MAICTQCGQQNPDGARFCNSCGGGLPGETRPVREERKVVTVLFCDLVGFTAAADSADPEDVSRALGAYHAAVRGEIERFGGTVEKFIGDAAVGVWGAPMAREDDAERAVRAALSIVQTVGSVRVAVNTGRALVKLAPGMDMGEGLVGDVVNTASRLQGVAPAGGVVVGEATMQLTRRAIEYRVLEPATLKGKAEPVPMWQAAGVRQPASDPPDEPETPFVGRQTEFELIQRVYDRVLAEPGFQQVTIVGEPGVGKSRLAAEFTGWLDSRPDPPVVHRGRCLAYGDGIGFWPLAEIVKAQLGIAETDGEAVARSRLHEGVEGMADAPWLRTRLAPLVGLPGEAGDREEVFTAWQRFLDEVAARTPLIVIVEDIHWADPAMLAFLRHLAEWSSGVPMLLACTTRPELLEAHAGWGGDLVNATTVAMRPLNEADTSQLAVALLARIDDSSDAAATLAARCGGNPLYAEEYARLLRDRTAAALGNIAMPDTVQALIAARIDTLPLERKTLLHDAAVIGKVFWAGALASVGDREPTDVRAQLHDLARKELIRRARTSTVAGDEQYAFWHDLVHDVAYSQIPRAQRAVLHQRTAEWIEQISEERVHDRAELLAYHYVEALSLTNASGDGDHEHLRRAAVKQLAIAGTQAMAVDWNHAGRLLREGLDLSQPNDRERTQLLCGLAEFEINAGRPDVALPLIRDAEAAAEAANDLPGLAEALNQRLWFGVLTGDRRNLDDAIRETVQRLEDEPPSAESAKAFVSAALFTSLTDNVTEARRLADHALQRAEAVGDEMSAGLAIQVRGLIRATDGDRGGLDDLRSSLAALLEVGSTWIPMGKYHLAENTLLWDGPEVAEGLFADAIDHAVRIGMPAHEMWARGEHTWCLADQGAWDELLVEADRILTWAKDHASPQYELLAAPSKARVLALRGDTALAREAMAGIAEQARRSRDPQMLGPTLAANALIEYLEANVEVTAQLLTELGSGARYCWSPTTEICRLRIATGAPQEAAAVVDGITHGPPRLVNAIPSVRGMLAETSGDHVSARDHYEEAAAQWRAYGHAYELAHALAGEARCLDALGHGERAASRDTEAASIFDRLGVRRPVSVV